MQCKVIMKTKTELLAELEQAQKRIAELEKNSGWEKTRFQNHPGATQSIRYQFWAG